MPNIKWLLIYVIACSLPLVCEASYDNDELQQVKSQSARLFEKNYKAYAGESYMEKEIFDALKTDVTKMDEREVQMLANAKIAKDEPLLMRLHKTTGQIVNDENKDIDSVFNHHEDDSLLNGVFACNNIDCSAPEFVASDDFNALMSLQATSEGKLSTGINKRNIFNGEYLSCRAMGYGYSNCCKEKGWGQAIGVAGCNSNEKKLGVAKEEGRVILLGSKCTKKDIFGKCLKKKKAYCLFKTKLAYLVQIQARPKYIRRSFGNYEYPDCQGFTLAEFQNLPIDQFKLEKAFGENRLYQDDFAKSNKKKIYDKAKIRRERGNDF